MAEKGTQPDTDKLQGIARGWLQAVHAIWDPVLETSQKDPNGLRLIFLDDEKRRHSMVINDEGFVVQYSGPQASSAAAYDSRPTTGAVPAQASPGQKRIPPVRSPMAASHGGAAIEDRVAAWIRDSIGLSSFSIIARESKGGMVQYTILDLDGNYFLALADRSGTVKQFEAVQSQPRVDAPALQMPSKEHGSQETTYLLNVARDWLSKTTGLHDLGICGSVWEEQRLKIVFRDPGGSQYMIYVRPPGVVDVFKPM